MNPKKNGTFVQKKNDSFAAIAFNEHKNCGNLKVLC